MRSAILTGLSFLLTGLVVGNAYYQRQQFYPSVVYITKSNPSMAIIYLQAFVFVWLFGKIMRKIFFGQLRAAEFEHLMERGWYAVTETCLAFTVFKDDFSPKFVALFTLLIFLKSFHWLAEDRVDFMERSPSISLLFHVRVLSLACLLASVDCLFISHAYHSTLTKGASVQLVFGFEYAILLTIIINTLVKYVLHSIDLHSENPWEAKAVFMLYAELIIGFIKVLLYVLFIVIMVRIYTLPLFAVRPMYLTMRAFKKAFNDVILSRRAIHNMNTWYPDATPEELAATDNVCIICREEMLAPSTKKLPCGHIFHKACLRSWFQRQQTCPTCRLDVLRAPLPNHVNTRVAGLAAAVAAAAQRAQPQAGREQGNTQNAGGQAPQAAAPAVGQNQPPFPPFDPNIFAQMLNNARIGVPQPTPQFNQTIGATSNAPNAQVGSSSNPSQTTPTMNNNQFPPPPLPSFAFAPPPFGIPPPMPPPNFSGLTTEELRTMEGNERENIEARVKCLRNVQVLLDAAVMEMQQYTLVVSRLNTTADSKNLRDKDASITKDKSTNNPTTSDNSSVTNILDSCNKEKIKYKTPEETGTKPKVKQVLSNSEKEQEDIIAKMDDDSSLEKRSIKPSSDKEKNYIPSEELKEADELRRRRLEKFSPNNGSNN